MLKLYWIIITLLNKLSINSKNVYFKFNNGLQNEFHFGFQLHLFKLVWRLSYSKFNFKYKLNNECFLVG